MSHRPCLAAREILEYLEGRLGPARGAEAELHLDRCRLCGTAVEGVAELVEREHYLRSTAALLARVRGRSADPGPTPSHVHPTAALSGRGRFR